MIREFEPYILMIVFIFSDYLNRITLFESSISGCNTVNFIIWCHVNSYFIFCYQINTSVFFRSWEERKRTQPCN